jgi:hypothetical protein
MATAVEPGATSRRADAVPPKTDRPGRTSGAARSTWPTTSRLDPAPAGVATPPAAVEVLRMVPTVGIPGTGAPAAVVGPRSWAATLRPGVPPATGSVDAANALVEGLTAGSRCPGVDDDGVAVVTAPAPGVECLPVPGGGPAPGVDPAAVDSSAAGAEPADAGDFRGPGPGTDDPLTAVEAAEVCPVGVDVERRTAVVDGSDAVPDAGAADPPVAAVLDRGVLDEAGLEAGRAAGPVPVGVTGFAVPSIGSRCPPRGDADPVNDGKVGDPP